MMVGFFMIAGKCDLSIILGTLAGSAASILNYYLRVIAFQLSAKYDAQKAIFIIWMSRMLRMLLMSAVAFVILLVPMLHDITGIIALFFPQISRAAMSIIKG